MPTLDAYVDTAVREGSRRVVGLAGAAVRDGATAFAAHGPADHSGRLVEERTLFEIGSITKVFTALLLAEMAGAGEVELDEPLARFFPGLSVPVRGRPITLRDLATHTSGLPRLPPGLLSQAVRHGDNPYARFTAANVEAALERVRLRSAPGRRIRYSNFGAGLLGEALARRAGAAYPDLVASRVCAPLGLNDTTGSLTDEQRHRRAVGHTRRGRPTPDWDMPALPGMGALHSTTADLARFLAAQLDPDATPLGEAIRAVQTVQFGSGRPRAIGLGWMVTPLGRTRHTMHWHNGGTGGAFSFVGFVRDAGTAVVLLTNSARSVDGAAVRLLTELTG